MNKVNGVKRYLVRNKGEPSILKALINVVKAALITGAIFILVVILLYVYFAVKNDWGWAKEPADLSYFGAYVSGTVGIFLGFTTLFVISLSMILQKQDNTDAIKAHTKAFVLSEYRAAISAALAELEFKNKRFTIDQPMSFEDAGKEKTITTTMSFWDFFHGGLRDWAPGGSFDRVILVRGNWNDYFDTQVLMEETLRIELHYYAVKISKLRYLIIRYVEEGGIPDLYLEELEDARLSKQYLAGPAFAVRDETEPSRISKSVIKVHDASALLIEKMEPIIK